MQSDECYIVRIFSIINQINFDWSPLYALLYVVSRGRMMDDKSLDRSALLIIVRAIDEHENI